MSLVDGLIKSIPRRPSRRGVSRNELLPEIIQTGIESPLPQGRE